MLGRETGTFTTDSSDDDDRSSFLSHPIAPHLLLRIIDRREESQKTRWIKGVIVRISRGTERVYTILVLADIHACLIGLLLT